MRLGDPELQLCKACSHVHSSAWKNIKNLPKAAFTWGVCSLQGQAGSRRHIPDVGTASDTAGPGTGPSPTPTSHLHPHVADDILSDRRLQKGRQDRPQSENRRGNKDRRLKERQIQGRKSAQGHGEQEIGSLTDGTQKAPDKGAFFIPAGSGA